MGLMTKDEYIESLQKMNPTAYMFGEKIIVTKPPAEPDQASDISGEAPR